MAANDRNAMDSRPATIPMEPRKPMTAPANTTLPALTSSPDAMSLVKALRRRLLLAVSLGVLVAAVVGVAAFLLLPSKFTAFALLQVSSKPTPFSDRPPMNNQDFLIVMKTTAARLKSRDVLMRTLGQDQVRNLHLIKKHPDTLSTLTWLEEFLKIEIQDSSELLTVSLTGEEPNDLQIIVNNMVKSFLAIIGNEDKSRTKERFEKSKILFESAKEKLTEKVTYKEGLLSKQGVKDPWAMMNLFQNTQTQLQQSENDLLRTRLELGKKKAQLDHVQSLKKKLAAFSPADIPERDVLDFDQNLRKEKDQIEALEKLYDRLLREGHPPDDSTVRETLDRMNRLKNSVEERMSKARAELMQKSRGRQEAELDLLLASMQTEVIPLENFVKETQDRAKTLTEAMVKINISTKKYELIDAEIAQEEKNTNRLFDVYKQAQMEFEAEPRVALIGEAELQNRDLKKRLLMLIAAPIGAFIFVLFAVAWWEFAARRIHEPDEVVTGLAMRVVGAVPELPDPKRRRNSADPQAEEILKHDLIESIDAIRTMLLRNAGTENLRVVMVTSAVGGEGKTTLASNLAMSLARAGRKTLLMDCDLRRPSAHQLFEQTVQPGFSEVILHEVDLPDAIRPTTADPNLFLLPAGLWDRDVVQELAKTGIVSMFEKLREEFDFIIVDSHPVLAATDSLLIGQHVDTVLVSLMRDVSQMHNVHAACQQFATLGIRVFGAVVNGVPVKSFGRTYQPVSAAA